MIQIQFIPIAEISPYEKNSNKHPESQLSHIERLMREVGWTLPALVRNIGDGYEMIAGHGRLQSA